MPTVSVHPYFCPFGNSFFLSGLRQTYGPENIRYTTKGFPTLRRSGFLKAIVHDGRDYRLFVDEWDYPKYDEAALEWCDSYVKRNIDPQALPARHAEKIVPAGPMFPVKLMDTWPALWHAANTWTQAAARAWPGYLGYQRSRGHLAAWLRQASYSMPVDTYTPAPYPPNYVFFCSYIWKDALDTNQMRALFVEACKSVSGITFEGGFTPRSTGDVPGFEKWTINRRYSHKEILAKTAASTVCFNTPAVERSFSWRLGESLALGKAIVSTPLERVPPAPLVHGRHIHFAERTAESIHSAVERICHDREYRRTLEQGARQYYLDHVAPKAVVRRALAEADRRAGLVTPPAAETMRFPATATSA